MIRRGGRRNSLAQSYEAVNWRRADGTMGMRNARILLSAREFLPLLRPLGRRTVGHFFRRLFHLCPPLKSSAAYYITECRAIHFNPFSRPIFSACPRSFPSSLSLILSHSTRMGERKTCPLPSRSEYQERTWPRPVAGLVDSWPKRAQSRYVASVLLTAACL